MTRVKTCGLNTDESVAAALSAGADYLGFIHYLASPRHVTLEQTAQLTQAIGRSAYSVQVVVDPDDALVDALHKSSPCDFIQLHGSESVRRCADISLRTQRPIIKAISVRSAADVSAAQDYLPHVHALLFDAKPPSDDGFLPGGNGLQFDWSIVQQDWLQNHFWFLSGGLDVQNVAQAIALTNAPAVDVSSGIEATPGAKDSAKIAAFVKAAKDADGE
ncbi:MAG: phosphoribosylanthranilate isomerase [Pseudomonadota bacterium]